MYWEKQPKPVKCVLTNSNEKYVYVIISVQSQVNIHPDMTLDVASM